MALTVEVAGKSDVGCVRTNNEDNFGYDSRFGIFVVCDGMGGQAAGEVASKMAVDILLDYFRVAAKSGNYGQVGEPLQGVSPDARALASAIQLANRTIYETGFGSRGLDAAIWGHISDGNLHPNVIPRSFADVKAGKAAILDFGREAIRLGGAPLAEHGVGRNPVKQQLLELLYGKEGINAMRAVKDAIDPDWKLAPGVLFSRT